MRKNIIFGYNDVLESGTKVKVKTTGYISTIGEVIGKPKILHCTVYYLTENDPNKTYLPHWYFRHELEIIAT